MALSDVLTKLKNQRTAIVSAINGKGGTLGADATLADCATAIGNISGGSGGSAFYKCAELVAAVAGAVQGATLSFHGVCQMDGMTPETADLSFTMEDTAKTGWERTWLSSDGTLRLQAKVYIEQSPGSDVDDSARTWFITSASNSATNVWEADQNGSDGPADPWNMSELKYYENGMNYNLTWTVSEASAGTPATWNGYKLVSANGYYVFETTATTGLTYSNIVPKIGEIYPDGALLIVSDYWHFEYALVVKTLFNSSTNNAYGPSVYGDGAFNADGWYVLTGNQTLSATGYNMGNYEAGSSFGQYNNATWSFKFKVPTGGLPTSTVPIGRLDKSYNWMQINLGSDGKLYIESQGSIINASSSNIEVATLAVDTEYRITFVFGSTNFEVYVNGEKKYSVASRNSSDRPEQMYLHTNGGGNTYSGTFWYKDLYLYARILTETEIAAL